MGLDISAYSEIQIVKFSKRHSDSRYDKGWHDGIINPHFPHAVPLEMRPHNYIVFDLAEGSKSYTFSAGSYSGYGLFRSTLAGAFLGTKDLYMARDEENGDWDLVHNSEGKPFYEMINFSDCDGVFLGPVCEKLYNDFKANREHYTFALSENNPYPAWEVSYFMRKYDDFTKAFNLARQNGIVVFH